MADIHSATAEIRRGKKIEEEERRRRKNKRQDDRMKIMVCPIPYGDHKERRRNHRAKI